MDNNIIKADNALPDYETISAEEAAARYMNGEEIYYVNINPKDVWLMGELKLSEVRRSKDTMFIAIKKEEAQA